MQKYQSIISGTNGSVIRNVPVTVLKEDGSLAEIFLDREGQVQAPNPLVTDSRGVFYFYAKNGRYSLRTAADGVQITDADTVLLFDPDETVADGPIADAVRRAEDAAERAETALSDSGLQNLVQDAQDAAANAVQAVIDANQAVASIDAALIEAGEAKDAAQAAAQTASNAASGAQAVKDSLLTYSGTLSATPEWSAVPAHEDLDLDAQTQAALNRIEKLKDDQQLLKSRTDKAVLSYPDYAAASAAAATLPDGQKIITESKLYKVQSASLIFLSGADRRISILDFDANEGAGFDNSASFSSADSIGIPVFIPAGIWDAGGYLPTGLYYGDGVIKVFGAEFSLDRSIPTRVNTGVAIDPEDPETASTQGRFFNLISGQGSGRLVADPTARATTIYGSEALQNAVAPARATGFGKQVFRYAVNPYSCDAFGADALGQGDYMNRSTALGANALKWAGSSDPAARLHDYYRDTGSGDGDFITVIGLNATTRWPTIRDDFIGSITTPKASVLPTTSTQVYQNVAVGRNALLHSLKSESNVAVGVNAMAHALSNSNNTAVGTRALRDCVSGNGNTALGMNAAAQNISGINNVAVGEQALALGSHTSDNVAIGSKAAYALTGTNIAPAGSPTARRNVYIGTQSGQDATDGAFNVGVGATSLLKNQGSNNIAVGAAVLSNNTTGIQNTAVGHAALLANTTGNLNVAIGRNALVANTTANENTAVGSLSLSSNVTGTKCVAVGCGALLNSTVDFNTAIGFDALRYSQSGGSHNSYSNCTGLGYNSRVSGSNQVQLGGTGTTTYAYGAVQDRSDARDKADVRDTVLGLDFIKDLRAVDFKWDMRDDYLVVHEDGSVEFLPKDGSKKRNRYHHGLIAQELREVMERHGVDFGGLQDHSINGGCDVLSIGYTELIGPLIKAVQELSAQVESLKAQVEDK